MWDVSGIACGMAEVAHNKHFAERLKNSKSAQETRAIMAADIDRRAHQRALQVAQASAPRITIVNHHRHYYY